LNYRGSNDELKYAEIPVGKLNTHWFYFSSMIGQSFKTLERLSQYAVKNNIHIAFTLSPYLAKKGIKFLKKILKNITILVMNKEESELLVGKGSLKRNLKKLSKYGPKVVAITDGHHGTHVLYKNHIYFGKPNNIKVVETTGAGDAFASSFLSGMIKKNDVEFAMQLGMTNAESVIQYHGAKNKLLSYSKALSIMKKRPIKVTKNFAK
jgi:ribokinase